MNSISPQMLGLTAGNVTLFKGPGGPGDQTPPRAAGPNRLLRVAMRRRWLLIASLAAGAVAGLLVNTVTPRQYASTARLLISRETAQVVNVGALSRDVAIGDQEFYQTQYGLLRAQALAERVAGDIGAIDDPAFFKMFDKSEAFAGNPGPAGQAKRREVAGEVLLEHVLIAPVHGSSLVDIQASTPSAALSRKIAEIWSRDFIASVLDRRSQASGYARQFLETRLNELRDRLQSSERRAMDYATAQGIVDLSSAGNTPRPPGVDATQSRSLLTDDLVALNAKLELATTDRIDSSSKLAAANSQPDASASALDYRAIGLLRQQRAEAASQYAKLATQASPDDPGAKAAHAQVDALDAAIKSEGDRVRASLQQSYQAASGREQALTQKVNSLKSALADLRQRSIQYNLYQRDADTNRELYNALLQRYKEIDVAGAVANNNVAVIDAPKTPEQPSSPRLSINLPLFTLAGAIIGALLAALLEQIDNGVAEPGEFEAELGLPLLGTAPKLKTRAPLEALMDARSDLVEAYLGVQASLELSTAQGAPRSLAVISTRPREGKSTTAIALAQTLARARRKVVLIDGNLRSSSLHSAFGLKNVSGVGALLAGVESLDAVLRPTEFEGLWVITAGPQPPNTADLLIGERLGQLVKQLEERFDHVIVDGPSVLGFADAPLVAAAVQSVIYAVAAKSAPAGLIRTALSQLHGARVAGGVLTLFEAQRPLLGALRGLGPAAEGRPGRAFS